MRQKFSVAVPPNVKLGIKLWNWRIALRGSWDWSTSIQGSVDRSLSHFTFTSDIPDDTFEYKFVIEDESAHILAWETGVNHIVQSRGKSDLLRVDFPVFQGDKAYPKVAGVSVPLFSLRGPDSWGIGEYPDLVRFIRWSASAGMRVVQLLPINDTTYTRTISDSYPYNPVSVHALNPLYLSLGLLFSTFKIQLENTQHACWDSFRKKGAELNRLSQIDYSSVCELKWSAFEFLWQLVYENVASDKKFVQWQEENKSWLPDYCDYCSLRDKETYAANMDDYGLFTAWIQYQCHLQMCEAAQEARNQGVLLKGDLPIGVSPVSVEVKTHPTLFKTHLSAGAPPDYFSERGQNWGFPTYDWDNMRAQDFAWWQERLSALDVYFDALRIDHILGFFRIWSIPSGKHWGLEGYFDKARGYSVEELHALGLGYSLHLLTHPYVTVHSEQEHRKKHPKEKHDDYQLWHQAQVLFVKEVKGEEIILHPRIAPDKNVALHLLTPPQQQIYLNLCDDYFYHRNDNLWRMEALGKLGPLLSMTHMLTCGEDLGMLPLCVPDVMRSLHLLSLEIATMPKQVGKEFDDLSCVPYESVLTTTTHDMAPMRLWWQTDGQCEGKAQRYYNEVVRLQGQAPQNYTSDVARQVVSSHLRSGAMMVIFPLQDLFALIPQLSTLDPFTERINVPDDPHNAWNYRVTNAFSTSETVLAKLLRGLLAQSGRLKVNN